ncbi:MAG: 2-hydroxy-6-oxonona-2,4-dienedioate hydrolase, partial [Mycobacterium sp.]|nr:2-hydroxy-6-oxonona-2,4-dienedioate hydrolase [Mycobacterium sp.]
MTQAQGPRTEVAIDTSNYRSIWLYLKELEFRQGFVDVTVNGTVVRTRY